MPTFIKAGFWEKTCNPCNGYKGWLNLDQFVGQAGTSGTSGTNGPIGPQGVQGTQGIQGVAGTSGSSGADGDKYKTTSTTSFTLGSGGTITVGTGLAYTPAQDVLITYDINNHQVSDVTTYNPATGVLAFGAPTQTVGSGTYTNWIVNLNGAAGGDGSSGTSGLNGSSGTSGAQGVQGIQGVAGSNGTSGTSGINGTAGTSGISGTSGVSITSYYGSFIFDSTTALTAAIPNPSSTAAIQVTDTTGFAAPGYMKIGSEIIGYTGKTATTFTGITRGVATSSAVSHAIGSSVSQAQWAAANVSTQVKIDETDLSNGVTLSNTGDVTVANAGTYNLQFSIQFENFGNDYDDVTAWFRVNGNPISKSASYSTISQAHAGSAGATIMTVNIFYTCVGGEVFSLMWMNDQGTAAITSFPPVNGVPQSPGVIFTVNRIA